mgnify:CR=1 FL=1
MEILSLGGRGSAALPVLYLEGVTGVLRLANTGTFSLPMLQGLVLCCPHVKMSVVLTAKGFEMKRL